MGDKMTILAGRGRGGNPESKKNLRKPKYIYFVFDSKTYENGKPIPVSGPHAFGVAYRKADLLNKTDPHRYFVD
jgi:hypothetical protein